MPVFRLVFPYPRWGSPACPSRWQAEQPHQPIRIENRVGVILLDNLLTSIDAIGMQFGKRGVRKRLDDKIKFIDASEKSRKRAACGTQIDLQDFPVSIAIPTDLYGHRACYALKK